jgi:lycopene cyclase domain-containing protein
LPRWSTQVRDLPHCAVLVLDGDHLYLPDFVDGWLTKLSAPIVIYNPEAILRLRAPWDIPIEDFGFGFAMVMLAILLWRRWRDRRPLPEMTEDAP